MSARSKTAESEYRFLTVENPPIWPEWSDFELNNEKWGIPRNGPDGLFLDPQTVPLPGNLTASKWIRAKELTDITEPLTIFTSDKHDLTTTNQHLLHHESVRSFISAIMNLENCGRGGLEISCEGTNFNWTRSKTQPWHAWMHVYSMNNAGKDAQHQPVVNPNGKYIVRLYFLGCWRRVTVDDMMPLNSDEQVLLPRTKRNSELWPMLLMKGILKLNPSPTDYHVVTYLTGWTCLRLSVKHLSLQDKWDFLIKYAEHFEWRSDSQNTENQDNLVSIVDTRLPEKGKPKEKTEIPKLPSKPAPVTLFLRLEDKERSRLETVTDWSDFVYVAQSRDIPLNPHDVKAPLARWKLYRWLRWAIGEGIIDPVEYFTPIRFLKMVCPSKASEFEKLIHEDWRTLRTNNSDSINSEKRKSGGLKKSQSAISEMLRKTSGDEILSESIVWADFNELGNHITHLYLYYKPEYFGYNTVISNIAPFNPIAERRLPKDDKKSSKKSASNKEIPIGDVEIPKTHFWPKEKSSSRLEPLYLYCDSIEKKFFLINFSTFHPSNQTEGGGDARTPRKDYLTLGRRNWFEIELESEPLAFISTNTMNSTVMELPEGRHLLQLLSSCESFCSLSISSDTVFHVGDRLKIYKLMSRESETIRQLASEISERAISLYQAFGTENYRTALRAFYKSYMPVTEVTTKEDKRACKSLHEIFMAEQVRYIRQTFSEPTARSIIQSLRIFFIDPSIGHGNYLQADRAQSRRESKGPKTHVGFVSLEEESIPTILSIYEACVVDLAAAKIQAIIKTMVIKNYKNTHRPYHKRHQTVLQDLEKLISLFQSTNSESIVHKILRDIPREEARIYYLHPYAKDLDYVLEIQEFHGSLTNIKPDQWFPIARLGMNAPMTTTVLASINLSADLPRHSTRVFRNQDYYESRRIINNVAPSRYSCQELGYTIFAYGWSEENRINQIDWTLTIATKKGTASFQTLDNMEQLTSDTKLPKLLVHEFAGSYIPNRRKCISKWILRCPKRSIVSLRLRVSYELAEMMLNVTDEDETVLAQEEGCSSIILPLVYLDAKNIQRDSRNMDSTDSQSTVDIKERVYYVEAYVLNDSWPLTETEWATVLDVKSRANLSKRKLSASSGLRTPKPDSAKARRSSRYSLQNVHPDPPFWTLQVVADTDSGLEIVEDKRKQKKLAELKESWWKENPNNFKRGKELREAFINEHAIKSSVSESQLSRTVLSTSSSEGRESKEVRTNLPPQLSDRHVPPLDLSMYTIDDDLQIIHHTEETDSQECEEDQGTAELIVGDIYEDLLEGMENLLDRQKVRYQKLLDHYKDTFWEGRARIDEIYEARKLCINTKAHSPERNIKSQAKTKKA